MDRGWICVLFDGMAIYPYGNVYRAVLFEVFAYWGAIKGVFLRFLIVIKLVISWLKY